MKNLFQKNHNDLTKKKHKTPQFCDDFMKNEKKADKLTFLFVGRLIWSPGSKHAMLEGKKNPNVAHK